MKRSILVLILLLFIGEIAFSQGFYNKNRNRNLVVSFGIGTTSYYGDLVKDGIDVGNVKPNIAIGARYNFYRWISFSTEATWFMLGGEDATDPNKAIRNLSFTSNNFELNGTVQVSLFEEDRRFYMRPFANPYVYGGIGFVSYNPKGELDGDNYNLRKLNTSGADYSGMTASFPVGGGVKFRVNPFFNIALDGGYRFLMTDWIDDVSNGIYPDPASFGTDEIARKLSDRTWETLPPGTPTWAEQGKELRGDPKDKDGYFMFNVKVEYYFAELGKSSTFRRRIKGGGSGYKLKAPKRRTNRQINQRRF